MTVTHMVKSNLNIRLKNHCLFQTILGSYSPVQDRIVSQKQKQKLRLVQNTSKPMRYLVCTPLPYYLL